MNYVHMVGHAAFLAPATAHIFYNNLIHNSYTRKKCHALMMHSSSSSKRMKCAMS
jgi:hypothetical protein